MFTTSNIKKPFQVSLFAEPDFIYDSFVKMLRSLRTSHSTKKTRVFKDNGVRYDLSILFKDINFESSDNIDEILCKEFDSDNYCVAISEIEKHSVSISNFFIDNIIMPWTRGLGAQFLGFELYCFLGKYAITPFGIHDDEEHTILFHLGPNNLPVYCWEPSLYNHITHNGESNYGNFIIDKIKQQSCAFILKPGDVLFIPRGVYHVMERIDFSITLGAIPYPLSGRKLIERFIADKLDKVIREEFGLINSISEDEIQNHFEKIGVPINNLLASIKIEDELNYEYLKLKSNAFLINKTDEAEEDSEGILFNVRKKVQLTNHEEYMLIFINGSRIKMNKVDSIVELVKEINSNSYIRKEKFLSILSKEISSEASIKVYNIFKNLAK